MLLASRPARIALKRSAGRDCAGNEEKKLMLCPTFEEIREIIRSSVRPLMATDRQCLDSIHL